MRRGRWVERGRRRSRVWSQQTGFGGLPQADEPVEPAHQRVHLLRARAGLGGGPEFVADARHFLAPLLPGFGGDLVARRFVLRHLPQVIGELLALGAELAEAVQERRVRAARRVGIAHCEVQLYPETGSEERLPGGPGVPSLRTPWRDPRSSSACAPSTDGPRAGPVPSR